MVTGLRHGAFLVALCAGLVVSTPMATSAQTEESGPSVLESTGAQDGRDDRGVIVGLADALSEVPADSQEYEQAVEQRDESAAELADAWIRRTSSEQQIDDLKTTMESLIPLHGRSVARTTKLTATLDGLQVGWRTMVVRQYVDGASDITYPDPNATIAEELDRAQAQTISSEAIDRLGRDIESVSDRLTRTIRTTRSLKRQMDTVESDSAAATAANTAARSDADRATKQLVLDEQAVRASRLEADVADTDLPMVALDAYWRAARELEETNPSCRIEWWALAGIGRSESNHGRFAGGFLQPGGLTSTPIFGIALDGTNGTRVIPDSDQGTLDNDPIHDRAVGVMQFIPGTWRRWATDASGDGAADPQNMYDAALAAGTYLCSYDVALDTSAGLRRAFFGYNHSESYVDLVLDRALGYRDAVDPGPVSAPASDDEAATPSAASR